MTAKINAERVLTPPSKVVLSQLFPQRLQIIILYNLACYAAQLGHLHSARARLAEAIALAPACQDMALKDNDLKLLWDYLRDGQL